MSTNTDKMIYATAMEYYNAVMICYTSRKFVYHVNKIFNLEGP